MFTTTMKVFSCIPVLDDGWILFRFITEILGSTVLTFPMFFEIIALVLPLKPVFCDEDVPGLDRLVAIKSDGIREN